MADPIFKIIFVVFSSLVLSASGLMLDKHYDRKEFLAFFKSLSLTQGTYNNIPVLNQIFEGLDLSINITEKCRRGLLTYRDFSLNSSDLWPLLMLDASGKIQAGLLEGNLAHLGNWHQCYSVNSKYLKAMMCSANIILPGSQPQASSIVFRNVPLHFSSCLPSSCTESDLVAATKPWASALNISVTFKCYPEKKSSTFLLKFSVLLIISLLVGSSVYDWWRPGEKQKINIWNVFSVQRNLAQLQASSNLTSTVNISSLNGLRVLSQLMVILYHVNLHTISKQRPIINKFYVNEFFSSWFGRLNFGLSLAVDTYLVMSGLLVSYTSLYKPSKYKLIGKYYFHRYIRITPSLCGVMLVIILGGKLMFSGPQGSSRFCEAESCRNYWWIHLLYANNYLLNMYKSCLSQSWYLALDWQLYMLSPLLLSIVSTCKNKRVVISLFSSLFVMSFIIPSFLIYRHTLPADEVFANSTEEHARFIKRIYTPLECRYGPWLVGFVVGIVLRNDGVKVLASNKAFKRVCWLVPVVLAGCFLWSVTPAEPQDRSLYLNAAYNTPRRNLWSLGVGCLILACVAGPAGAVNRFLSCKIFEPLSKLSYGVYLINTLICYLVLYDIQATKHFSIMKQATSFITVTVISYLASLLLYLTFEAPFCNLDKLYTTVGPSLVVNNTVDPRREQFSDNGNEKLEDHQSRISKTNGAENQRRTFSHYPEATVRQRQK